MIDRYRATRHRTVDLCRPLCTEDYVVQTLPHASPAKWHLAHTTWFFETFLLKKYGSDLADWAPSDPEWDVLFNSYYEAVGAQWPRDRRGLLSRPTVEQVYAYRARVDEAMIKLLHDAPPEILRLAEIGLHHEQQHQELLLTDLKHVFASNPLRPVYRASPPATEPLEPAPLTWRDHRGGIRTVGASDQGFSFDNERPQHAHLIAPFQIADRLVTAGEWLDFMIDGGYQTVGLWLSNGWQTAQAQGWRAPMYWEERDGAWWRGTLGGMVPVDPGAPVCHISYFEADAYASWAGARLPTEQEWEVASADAHPPSVEEPADLEPQPIAHDGFFGQVWQWTRSAYAPYPGYRSPDGALGEYNAKFMCEQTVLRGGSRFTPPGHIRATYRNFFPAATRWQLAGLRLARDTP